VFRSIRTRLVVLIASLVLLTQALAFVLVDSANTRNATLQIARDLELAAGMFDRFLAERSNGLIANARLLSGDFAFKQAFATGDSGTILSAMENHLQRIAADQMVLLDPDGALIADTGDPQGHAGASVWAALVERAGASADGEASGIVTTGGGLLQVTVVPLYTPDLSAWVLFGFAIDDRFAHEIGKISEVSVLLREGTGWRSVASTLASGDRAELPGSIARALPRPDRSVQLDLGGVAYISLVKQLTDDGAAQAIAVLQRPLAAELAPFRELRRYLVVLFAAGFALSALAAVLVARGVSRPVLQLASGVRRVAAGDYAGRVDIEQQDEIGQLATAFNAMARDLQDRERVRDLLGKVVSPAIAEQLLRGPIELGGEEREVTILFADVRNFTRLCEGIPATAVLALLNRYLTRITEVIEAYGGVVDKYVGDAVMALFGAPLPCKDHASRAVGAALAMLDASRELNLGLEAEGLPSLRIGVGINTARVVAGNMGSMSRMNYTVIGDGVNLAARLEALTRSLGVTAVVGESTRAAASGYRYRQIDRVRVRGRNQAVTIWEPLARGAATEDAIARQIAAHERAIEAYAARDWARAARAFASLAERFGDDPLYTLYTERCRRYLREPPPAAWDGVQEMLEK
jgi:adenylate cyclase